MGDLRVVVYRTDQTPAYIWALGAIADHKWYYAVWTYDAGLGITGPSTLYPDGTAISTIPEITGELAAPDRLWTIGSGDGGSWFFNGLIDEVRIHNRASTAGEISDLYNNHGYTTPDYPGKVLVRKFASPRAERERGGRRSLIASRGSTIKSLIKM